MLKISVTYDLYPKKGNIIGKNTYSNSRIEGMVFSSTEIFNKYRGATYQIKHSGIHNVYCDSSTRKLQGKPSPEILHVLFG